MWPFNRHKHSWKVLRIEQGEYSLFGKGAASLLYLKCAGCKDTKSVIRDGWWKMEDFE